MPTPPRPATPVRTRHVAGLDTLNRLELAVCVRLEARNGRCTGPGALPEPSSGCFVAVRTCAARRSSACVLQSLPCPTLRRAVRYRAWARQASLSAARSAARFCQVAGQKLASERQDAVQMWCNCVPRFVEVRGIRNFHGAAALSFGVRPMIMSDEYYKWSAPVHEVTTIECAVENPMLVGWTLANLHGEKASRIVAHKRGLHSRASCAYKQSTGLFTQRSATNLLQSAE